MKVMLYCSLSESITKILALWMDGTVSYVALDSVLQHYIELVMEAALLPLSMVQEMIQEWMVRSDSEREQYSGTTFISITSLPEFDIGKLFTTREYKTFGNEQ